MNTEQKLTKIREKCVAKIDYAKSNVTDLYGGDAIAALEATIAAIDMCESLKKAGAGGGQIGNSISVSASMMEIQIIAAWEGLV